MKNDVKDSCCPTKNVVNAPRLVPLFEDSADEHSVDYEEIKKIREILGDRIPNMFSFNPAARDHILKIFTSGLGERVSYVLREFDPDKKKKIVVNIVKSDTGIVLNCRRRCHDLKFYVGLLEENDIIKLIICKF